MADEAAVSPEKAREPALVLDDADFLSIVQEQRRQSIGFGFANDSDLAAERETALEYFKGQMDDIPSLENRSAAVSTDVAEAVETVTPDLVEMLTSGDEVVTFLACSEADEPAAEQETDYVRHVAMQENPGFLTLVTGIKDALLTKLGVFKAWWEPGEEDCEERHEGKSVIEYAAAVAQQQAGEIELEDVEVTPPVSAIEQPTYSYTVCSTKDVGRARWMAVPADDFTVAKSTVQLADSAYCAMKSRPYVQDLIAQGYDKAKVQDLPAYSGGGTGQNDEITNQARDVAGEHTAQNGAESTHPGLKIVEIVEHYVRVDADDDGKPELWKVVTGGGETVFLAKEKVEQVPFAVITPYLTPHRLYGRSLADVLLEIQRIKTALLRMLLDSGYFALNQRHEVAMDQSNAFTLADLLRNAPAAPIRSKNGNAVRPITGPGLSFDVQGALEYVSTMGEQRSGVKRHSMGLNPDTLHETASGALSQLDEARRRIRFMGRVFAETGLKDLFLLLHNIIRTNARQAATVKLRGTWTDVDPSQWQVRKSMTVEVGPGRDHMLASLNMLAGWMKEAVAAQGGSINGPLATAPKMAKLMNKLAETAGIKGAYFPDENEVKQAMQQQAAQPPQPDPKALLAQASHANDQAKIALQGQQLQLDGRKQSLAEAQFQAEQQAAMAKAQADDQFRWAQLKQEAELAIAQIQAEYKTTIDAAQIKAEAEQLRAGTDLTLKAASQHHDLNMAAHEAQHAADAMSRQHMHDHVSAVRDAALTPPPAEPAPSVDPNADPNAGAAE